MRLQAELQLPLCLRAWKSVNVNVHVCAFASVCECACMHLTFACICVLCVWLDVHEHVRVCMIDVCVCVIAHCMMQPWYCWQSWRTAPPLKKSQISEHFLWTLPCACAHRQALCFLWASLSRNLEQVPPKAYPSLNACYPLLKPPRPSPPLTSSCSCNFFCISIWKMRAASRRIAP